MSHTLINTDKSILIVGLGLIGGSYATALSQKGFCVSAIDVDAQSIAYAKSKHIITDGSANKADYIKLIKAADAVIFGLYPTAMIGWVDEYKSHFKHGCIITDVSGVKRNVVSVIQDILPDYVEFIGSHPMAGREVSGVSNSNIQMFSGANFLITPTSKNTEHGISFATQLGQLLGFARISVLSLDEHDEMIGYLSQLTHAIAVSLMNANDNPNLQKYTGDSFRDLTRIAKINEHLWSELFMLNKDILVGEIDCFTSELQRLKQCLVNSDTATLKQMFVSSTKRRSYF